MPEQMFFEDTPVWRGEEEKKPTPTPLDEEPINCQYCEDGGPCTYCKRGQEEQARIAEEQKEMMKSFWRRLRGGR